ncbi:MAG TPA: peptidase M1 [Bacteroidales bacterium]|nr:MAG: hypothetical protein A2W98_02355 [Bacteroidetes bacterium GWF2_33_38]OFY76621.1 MAG: hypothetical protein A2265_07150 [Bacteroidetes bacterium RIFOXYA12_FULL_33_9]HBF88539.1 peptidase M1 [Bacteroidales bacterium]
MIVGDNKNAKFVCSQPLVRIYKKNVMDFFFSSILWALVNLFLNTDVDVKSMQNSQHKNQKNITIVNDYDLLYHRIYWEIDPNVRYIKGRVFSTMKYPSNDVSSISFNLSDSLVVDSVLYHNENIDFIHFANLLSFSVTANVDEIDSVEIFYQGIPSNEDGGFTFFQGQTDSFNPIITTLSEPYGAMLWWPNKQTLFDKIDSIDIFINTPSEYKAASIGILKSETISALTKTAHWQHRYPITPYLVALAVSNYVTYSDYVIFPNGDSLEILNYVYPENYNNAVQKTPKIIPVISLFNDTFMTYPFKNEKYGHVQWELGGGMEHQTMTFLNSFDEQLMFHELAHSWFGNYITCGSWQDIWLNEGFATYFTIFGFNEYYYKLALSNMKSHVTNDSSGSVYVYDTTDVARIFDHRLSYNKGAMVLHGLRWYLGDSLFFASIKSYLSDEYLAYGFARSNDLIHHFENTSNVDLHEFFNDWIYGEGYPTYDIEYFQNNSNQVHFIVKQSQSHSSIDFFEMYLPIKFYGEGHDSLVRVYNSFSGQEFVVDLDFIIDSVKLDPDNWILTRNEHIAQTLFEFETQVIEIYPNPTREMIYLTFPEKLKLTSVSVYSTDGKKVLENLSINTKTVDIKNLNRGIYFVKLNFSNQTQTLKILKY